MHRHARRRRHVAPAPGQRHAGGLAGHARERRGGARRSPRRTASRSPSSPSTTTSSTPPRRDAGCSTRSRSPRLKVVIDPANLFDGADLDRQARHPARGVRPARRRPRPRPRQGRPPRRDDRRRRPRRPRLRALPRAARERRRRRPADPPRPRRARSRPERGLPSSDAGTDPGRLMAATVHNGICFSYMDRGSGTPFVFQHGLGGPSSWSPARSSSAPWVLDSVARLGRQSSGRVQ